MMQRSAMIKPLTAVAFLAISSLGPLSAQQALTVTNGAGFARTPVAQGSIASIFGNFAGVAVGSAQAVPLPTNISNVRVLIGTTEAPLFYVSPTQINFQVPRAVAVGNSPIRVTGGTAEVAGTINVIDVAPGIFVADYNAASRPGAILNQDNAANSQTARAARNSVIQVFATGVGPVQGMVTDGAAGPTPPATNTRPPRAYIGGVEATVQFAGLSPQFAGVHQVNILVPDRPFVSGQITLEIFADGVPSNPVSFWVAD